MLIAYNANGFILTCFAIRFVYLLGECRKSLSNIVMDLNHKTTHVKNKINTYLWIYQQLQHKTMFQLNLFLVLDEYWGVGTVWLVVLLPYFLPVPINNTVMSQRKANQR